MRSKNQIQRKLSDLIKTFRAVFFSVFCKERLHVAWEPDKNHSFMTGLVMATCTCFHGFESCGLSTALQTIAHYKCLE